MVCGLSAHFRADHLTVVFWCSICTAKALLSLAQHNSFLSFRFDSEAEKEDEESLGTEQ